MKKPSPFRLSDKNAVKNFYIDKLEMLELIKEYQSNIKHAEQNGLEEPVMGKELAAMIIATATNLTKRYNFHQYTFTETFISDSILLGLKLAKIYDVDHEMKNPYGYFTLAFFRLNVAIIKKEKRLLAKKLNYISQLDIDLASYQDHDDGHNNQYIQYLQEQVDQIRSDEQSNKIKENFIEDDNIEVEPKSKIQKYFLLGF